MEKIIGNQAQNGVAYHVAIRESRDLKMKIIRRAHRFAKSAANLHTVIHEEDMHQDVVRATYAWLGGKGYMNRDDDYEDGRQYEDKTMKLF